ncbi:MAG: TlpA disulfide reductase family protein [Thermodesulfobacteriota bacterium]
MKKSVVLLLLLLLCIAGQAGAVTPPWEIDGLKGAPAPAFSLADLDGRKQGLDDFSGKTVLLNFWATWCGPCRAEMPALNRLAEKYRDRGLVVVGVSVDQGPDVVIAFLKKLQVSFPVLMDSDMAVTEQYKVYAFPTTFLIDAKGTVRDFYLGEKDWEGEEFRKELEAILQ